MATFRTDANHKTPRILLFWIGLGLAALSLVVVAALSVPLIQRTFFSGAPVTDSQAVVELQSLWDARDWPAVVTQGKDILSQDPLHFQALTITGMAAYYYGNSLSVMEERTAMLNLAVTCMRQAMTLEPWRDNGDLMYILGKTYYAMGYYYHDLSLTYLEKALSLSGTYPDIHEYLGVLSAGLGHPEDAIDHFRKALNATYDERIHLAILTSYISMDEMEEAKKELGALLEKAKDPYVVNKARFVEADFLFREGKNLEARKAYEAILGDDPASADAHYYLGEIYNADGDTIKARAEWRSAVLLDPSHSAALNRLNNSP